MKDYVKQEALRSCEAEIFKAQDDNILSDDGGSLAQHIDADNTDSSDADNATVKLSHSSVARFFRYSDKIEITGKNTTIGVSRADAHLRLAKACLKLLCSNNECWTLVEYAALNFQKHLSELNWANIPKEDKADVARYLLRLFRNDNALNRLLFYAPRDFWPDWYQTTGPFQICWDILTDQEVQQELMQEDDAWASDTGVSRTEKLFKPAAKYLAEKWLLQIDNNWNEIGCWYHVHSMIKLVRNITNSTRSNFNNY